MSNGVDDPALWKQISGWMWTLLAIPVAGLWRKVESAVTKAELREAMDLFEKSHDVLRDSTVKLFENAEFDRRRTDERFTKMQDTIHGIHVEVLKKLR